MIGKILTLVFSLGLIGCVGADGQIIGLGAAIPQGSSTGLQGAQGSSPDSAEEDPGSGGAHPSFGELETADTNGGTTDGEPPFAPHMTLNNNIPNDPSGNEDPPALNGNFKIATFHGVPQQAALVELDEDGEIEDEYEGIELGEESGNEIGEEFDQNF